jgi:hypothetical protein
MHRLLGMLVAVMLAAQIDAMYPIELRPEHDAMAWTVELQGSESVCRARAWIGRMGEQPLATLLTVELDETVAPKAEGETPLLGMAPGTYDLHFESDGCAWAYSLVSH